MIAFKEAQAKQLQWLGTHLPGLLLVFALAIVATWLGGLFPVIGGPVIGIIIAIILNNTTGKPASAVKGVGFAAKKILQAAIVFLGAGLSMTQVWQTGLDSLTVVAFTLTAAFLAAYLLGKIMRISFKLNTLIGVGTAICGGSAIAAVSPIVEADEQEIAYAISTVFLFNVIAVLIFPPLGHLIGFSDQAFGLWAGTAINDTSSVVAAGYAYSNDAGAYATIVKLTRTTMIVPVSLIFAGLVTRHKMKKNMQERGANFEIKKVFPWFILLFLVASLLNTLGMFGQNIVQYLNVTGKFMIVMALTAVGLGADFKKMLKTGFKPLLLGLMVWFVVAAVSVAVQFVSGRI